MTSSSCTSPTASGLLLRPAAQRFHSQLDWLESLRSFSFSSHYEKAWLGYGLLRMIREPRRRAARISYCCERQPLSERRRAMSASA